MESRILLKYVHPFGAAMPFLVPWYMILFEEIYGVVVAFQTAMFVVFVISVAALYFWGVFAAFHRKNKADRLYDLFMFHFVKIPLFVLALLMHSIILIVYAFLVNGFDGIQ